MSLPGSILGTLETLDVFEMYFGRLVLTQSFSIELQRQTIPHLFSPEIRNYGITNSIIF
jgi:hypothetical protein